MKYRTEIDGLRALAVLPVLFFHADFDFFSGGFIGVDVFFVISGFLITSIILEDLSQSKFSILRFYERRARRILPALMFMALVTMLVSFTIMPDNLFKEFGLSLLNVFTFTSNIYFYITSGYFSTIADEKPLLHTWSLAVEEQYYLLFPLFLMFFFNRAKKWILKIVLITFVMSLCYSHYLTYQGHVEASFYLITSRAWELLAGSILALHNINHYVKNKSLKEICSLLGLIMLMFSYVVFNKKTPLPGFYSLVPVVGTMLLIAFATNETKIGRLLSQKVLVFIGLISYSLYLWHQPILAFVKMKSIGSPSSVVVIFGLIASFILAIFSWKYIEGPFRNRQLFTRNAIYKYSIVGIVVSVATGLLIYLNDGLKGRFHDSIEVTKIKYSPQRKNCHTSGLDYIKPDDGCKYFVPDNTTWAVYGDSHSAELAYSTADFLKDKNEGLHHLTFSTCPAAAFVDIIAPKGCGDWSREAVDFIVNNNEIKNVVLSFRYSYHLFGKHIDVYPRLPNKSPLYILPRSERKKSSHQKARDYLWSSFEKTIYSIVSSGKRVFIVYPVPELPLHIKKMMAPRTIFSNRPTIDLNKAISIDYYNKRNEYVIDKLDALNYGASLVAIKPVDLFCDDVYCQAVDDQNQAYYADDNHMSLFGAGKVTGQIMTHVSEFKD